MISLYTVVPKHQIHLLGVKELSMFTTANIKHLIIAGCLVTLSAHSVFAGPTLTVTGEGTAYSVIGSGMDGIGGIQLELKYDTSSLSSPAVNQGSLTSGAMMAANTNNPGSINIAIISASKSITGSGQIVAISFASSKGTGGISSCTASLVDSLGKSVLTTCTVPGSSGSTDSSTVRLPFSTPTATTIPSGNVTPTPPISPVFPGTMNPVAETPPKPDTKPLDIPAPAAQPVETAAPAPAPVVAEAPLEEKQVASIQKPRQMRTVSPTATLESFRTYQGEKSPAIFVALMTREVSPTIHQEPVVALSDGTTTVKIRVMLTGTDEESPNFALNGAKMVSLNKDAATWIIEAQPQMGILQASLTILAGSEIIEFPLTLAPPVAGLSADEADFAAFLKDNGVVPPKRDLNGDRRHNYLDDFIYTANYLSLKGAMGKAR